MLSRHHRGVSAAAEVARAAWDPARLLFPEQAAVWRDRSRLRVVDGTRRCGKSFEAAVELVDEALTKPGARCLFLALTRDDARELVWEEIRALNDRYMLGGVLNEVRLEAEFPNGSRVRVGGAKDRRQAERRRGRFYDLVIIDEAQLFPSHLRELVEGILKPALMGRGRTGRIMLMGTPAEIPGIGYWEERVADKRWSPHSWSLRDNPHLGTPAEVEAFLAEMADTMGGTDSARFRREFLGERPPPDKDSDRPYRYDPTVNHYDSAVLARVTDRKARRYWTRWALPLGGRWIFIFGIDLGSKDASAIAVLGATDAAPGKVWLVEEFISPKLTPDIMMNEIQARRPTYSPLVMAVDEGGLGKMIAEGWRAPPYHLPVTPADKMAFEVSADFVSGALSRGDLMIPKTSRAAEDMAVLRWDPNKWEQGKRKIALQPHSDIEPAIRYAFKDAYAHATALRPPKVKPATPQDVEDLALARERRAGRQRASDMRRSAFSSPGGARRNNLAVWRR